jgi:hypothetical protein
LFPAGVERVKQMIWKKKRNILFYSILNLSQTRSHGFSTNIDLKENFKDKETYIMSKWVVDFPTHATLSYDEVSSLSSRSRDIGKWFLRTSNEFNLYKEAPSWFLAAGRDASEWSRDIQDKYATVKELNREYSRKINEISSESRKKMDALDTLHKEKLVQVLSETPELVFELINSQMLPFETHLRAFEYTSKEEAKKFIDNELRIFKERKYRDFLSGDVSSTELVDMLFAK